MDNKYFIAGFFAVFFILLGIVVAIYSYLLGKVSREILVALWGAFIFLFILGGIIAISLIVNRMRG
jgi:hypothetical protein